MVRLVSLCIALAFPVGHQQPYNEPVAPYRVIDNVYYVGSSDLASLLITTPVGDILIDGGYDTTVPIIRANLATLGFKLADIRILLNTQAHFDHAGGFAELKRLTGAKLMVSGLDADVIERGGHGDFLFGDSQPFPAATVDRRLEDGDTVRLGGVVLTAHVTGGHTRGCTTWTWDVHDKGRALHVVDVGGTTVLDGMNLAGMPGYPSVGKDFERTFAVLASLPVDVFLGAHASYFNGTEKAERLRRDPNGPNPFIDPEGYRAAVARWRQRFEAVRRKSG